MIHDATTTPDPTPQVIPREQWERSRAEYLARVRPWAEDRLRRMSRRQKHPVYDFLFEYYSFRPAHLLRWTPGFGVVLESATRDDNLWSEFQPTNGGLTLPAAAFPAHRVDYLRWAVEYLHATLNREPNVRHARVPLRLSRGETDAVVESQPLRCSHYDAFRFFTPAAVPLNRWVLTRATTIDHDQPGCLHVNMDLHRFAYKIAPFCPSDVVADAFELALAAREIDMRASPYDLTALGFAAIEVETAEGRAEYVERQRDVFRRAQPVRERLLGVYRGIVDHAVPHPSGVETSACVR